MSERYRMETIGDIMLPFIVDNESAKKNGKTTSYHTYETHRKEKCMELVELLNNYHETSQFDKKHISCLQSVIQDISNEIEVNNNISEEKLKEIKNEYANKMLNNGE